MQNIRGEFSFTLGKKKYQASLTLNALRLMCNAFDVKLDSLDKRMWRLEAMIMGSTLLVVAMVVTVFMGMN